MACDMCGKTGTSLTELMECYTSEDIKSICSSCERKLNSHLWKLRKISRGYVKTTLKEFMSNYRKESLCSNKE